MMTLSSFQAVADFGPPAQVYCLTKLLQQADFADTSAVATLLLGQLLEKAFSGSDYPAVLFQALAPLPNLSVGFLAKLSSALKLTVGQQALLGVSLGSAPTKAVRVIGTCV
jgi:hypothetical protein